MTFILNLIVVFAIWSIGHFISSQNGSEYTFLIGAITGVIMVFTNFIINKIME